MIDKDKIGKELKDNRKIEACALRFGVTGDKTRLKICYLLCHYPKLSVSEIAETIDSPISTISRSLKKLRTAGVVSKRRVAKEVFYFLEDNSFVSLIKEQLLI